LYQFMISSAVNQQSISSRYFQILGRARVERRLFRNTGILSWFSLLLFFISSSSPPAPRGGQVTFPRVGIVIIIFKVKSRDGVGMG
jgi:hypothetical protein